MLKAKHNSDMYKIKRARKDKAREEERYLDGKIKKLNKAIAKNLGNEMGSQEQDTAESLAKPKKKTKMKQKKVNFYPSSNQESEGEPQQNLISSARARPLGHAPELPPRHPDTHVRSRAQMADLQSRNTDGSRRSVGGNSSVENYQRYYQENRPDAHMLCDLSQTQSRIEPEPINDYNNYLRGESSQVQLQDPQNDVGGDQDFIHRSRKHYNEYKENQSRQKKQKKVNQFFEPQFIKENAARQDTRDESSDDGKFQRVGFGVDDRAGEPQAQVRINYGMNWIAKPTKEGFLYFCIPGTNTYQWGFPKVYDANTRQSKYLFISHWEKKQSPNGATKYWQHRGNPNFKQNVKPHSQTYLIQAAIEGNLAFLELYTKFKGDLAVCDQSGRSALLHAISNGHLHFAKMLCEFTQVFKHQSAEPATFTDLVELPDRHGNTPLFIAIRVNNPAILEMLISYQCNLLHRRKNGNTCLHECAIHSSIDCLTLLASYCGQDLFHVINKEGYRAVDLALRQQGRAGGSSEITIALQKIERNLMYQNAVVDSNLAYADRKRQPSARRTEEWPRRAKGSTAREQPRRQERNLFEKEEVSSLSSNSEVVRPRRGSRRPKTSQRGKRSRRRQYSESSGHRSRSQSTYRSVDSHGRLRHLEQRFDHLQYNGGAQGKDKFDERRYLQHVRQQRKERRQKRLQEEYVPNFENFREEIKHKRKDTYQQKKRDEELDQEYQKMFEEQQLQAGRRRGHSRKALEPESPSGQGFPSSKTYYERMRHQKNHFAQAFGEESYFRVDDFEKVADKSKSRSKIIQANQSRMSTHRRSRPYDLPEEAGEQDGLVREATRRMYSPGEEEDEEPRQATHKSISRRPHEGEMYSSRFVNNTMLGRSQNFTIDDIEKQRFRVPRQQARDEPEVESCDERQVDQYRPRRSRAHSVRALRDQGYSIVERAYKNTTSTLYTLGSYIYNGLSRVRDLIHDPYYQHDRRGSRGRARSVHYEETWMNDRRNRDLDYYDRGRSRPRPLTYRHRSRDYSSYSDDDSQPSAEQYYTAHGNARSQSRAASRARSRTLQRAPVDHMAGQPHLRNKYPIPRHSSSESSEVDDEQEHRDKIELFSPVTDQHDGGHKMQQQIQEEHVVVKDQKQSVSIQADSMIRKTKRKKVRTIKRSRIEASKHSIGVGSICIDDEINIQQTETVYETIKLPQKKITNINNETVQSIASQKLEHSRMISFQRQRRTGKRLGKKAQQNLMESKHFQSSDEEKLQIQQSIKLSEQLEPAPHYLKQEVNYIKVKDAYEKQDADQINAQLKRMQELEEEQKNLLKMQQEKASAKSLQIIDNLDNYDKTSVAGHDVEKKEQSTPTRQSTQQNRKSLEAHPASNHDKDVIESSKDRGHGINKDGQKKPTVNNDIDDFYNQLLANNLSSTKIEEQDNDPELQKVLAQVQQLDREKKQRQQNQDPALKELYSGLEMTEEQALTAQLDQLRKDNGKDGGMAFSEKSSEIEFDIQACNDSLRDFVEQDTITDLEAAGADKGRQHAQKIEQLEFFGRYSDGRDSLDMALEGSWLHPVQNFGECLSDCTFILEQDKNVRALYGSQMQSNAFDKGQFMNSMNNYSYYSQTQGGMKRSMSNVNLSMGVGQQILAGLNHNNSGFGFMTNGPSLLSPSPGEGPRPPDLRRASLKKLKPPALPEKLPARPQSVHDRTADCAKTSQKDCGEQSPVMNSEEDKHFEMIDEDKFNRVIESNIKAIPKRRIPLHSRSVKGPIGRKRSGSSMSRKLPIPDNVSEQSKRSVQSKAEVPEKALEIEDQAEKPVQQLAQEEEAENEKAHNDSSVSLEPGAMTRISDEHLPPRVDQAICDEKAEEANDTEDHHVEVARNYAEPEAPEKPQETQEAAEAPIAPEIQAAEEIQLEQSQQSLPILKQARFGPSSLPAQETPSLSARRYEQEADESSILEKSDVAQRKAPKSFKSITGGEVTMEKSQAMDQTNADCTEIDFNLTQLNQTSMLKNSQLPPGGKNYTQIEQIDEEMNEGEASAKRQPDSVGGPSTFAQMKNQLQASLSFAGSKVASRRESCISEQNDEEKEQAKPEAVSGCPSPLRVPDKAALYGTFNPCSEPGSSDADVPKLKPLNQKALMCLVQHMPTYPSDLEPSKLQSHKLSSQLIDPLQKVRTFDAQTISNSAKSPHEGPISHHDGNSILGKSGGGSILGNLLAQKRPYTSEEESLQARNMRKWQSLKPPKEGAKNLRIRVSSQSRSRGSSPSPQKKSDKGSQRSRTSDVQKNHDHLEPAPKDKNTDSEKKRPQTPSNCPSNNESKKNQLAEKLQKLKRPSMLSNFQSTSNRLNSTNLSNRKSIRDVSFRNGNTSTHGFGAGASSILTDNSERLRDNLESFKKSRTIREARGPHKQQSDPRKKYRAQPIKDEK